MLSWLGNNAGTILVTLALAGIAVLIIRRMIKDKKQGKRTCSGNCARCGLCETCHKQ